MFLVFLVFFCFCHSSVSSVLNDRSHGDAPVLVMSQRPVSPKHSRHHLTCPLWRRCGNRKWWDFENITSRDKVGTGHVICGLHISESCSKEKRHKRAARRQFGSRDDEVLLLKKQQQHTKYYSFVPTLPAFIIATSCFTHRPIRRLVCFVTPVKSEPWRWRHHQLPVV